MGGGGLISWLNKEEKCSCKEVLRLDMGYVISKITDGANGAIALKEICLWKCKSLWCCDCSGNELVYPNITSEMNSVMVSEMFVSVVSWFIKRGLKSWAYIDRFNNCKATIKVIMLIIYFLVIVTSMRVQVKV